MAACDARGCDFEIGCRANHGFFELLHVPADVATVFGEIEDGVADDLSGAVVGDVAAAVGFVEGDVHLGQQAVAGAEMFFFSVAAQGDDVGVLAEEQDVGDGASFAGFDELILERAGWGVGQEACVYLPADFFWVVHVPLKTRRRLPRVPWRTEVRRYESEAKAVRSRFAGPAATKANSTTTAEAPT